MPRVYSLLENRISSGVNMTRIGSQFCFRPKRLIAKRRHSGTVCAGSDRIQPAMICDQPFRRILDHDDKRVGRKVSLLTIECVPNSLRQVARIQVGDTWERQEKRRERADRVFQHLTSEIDIGQRNIGVIASELNVAEVWPACEKKIAQVGRLLRTARKFFINLALFQVGEQLS